MGKPRADDTLRCSQAGLENICLRDVHPVAGSPARAGVQRQNFIAHRQGIKSKMGTQVLIYIKRFLVSEIEKTFPFRVAGTSAELN